MRPPSNSPHPASPSPAADDALPIADIPAEMVCLSALTLACDALYAEVRGQLATEMFLSPDHQAMFRVIADIRDKGGPMDGSILYSELDRRGILDDVGGGQYVVEVVNAAPAPENGRHYVKQVVETHRLRQVEEIGRRAQRMARLPTDGTRSAAVIEDLQSALAALAGATATNSLQTLGEAVRDAIADFEAVAVPKTIPTGIHPLDVAVGGLGLGEMTLIAARPSMGKSLLGKQIAENIAARGVPVFFGNVEENNAKTARNWLSRSAKIDNHRIRERKLTAAERAAMPAWADVATDRPFYLCDKAMSLGAMLSAISLAHARYGIKVAFVDYLQLLELDGGGDNRQEKVAEISRRLKNLFKKLNIAGVVMAQLNRGNEAGQVRPPRLSDLRESGQLEQDADAVLMIHRPDFYCRENGQQPTGRVQVIVAKYRDGSREGDIELTANLAHQEFVEVDVFSQGWSKRNELEDIGL